MEAAEAVTPGGTMWNSQCAHCEVAAQLQLCALSAGSATKLSTAQNKDHATAVNWPARKPGWCVGAVV